ncbi:hypothetical protein G7Y89_g1440 [Cudoniella acicularis]|uniref:Uncharacterized protein n=1 Tax=Cudoniella acicularis TaxID=354080 RepID=A0A8H4RV94_9HELO|nr:hypothetical protein G7Y89_g1440 [Cudoniella acicularis]
MADANEVMKRNLEQALGFISKVEAQFPKDKSDTYQQMLEILRAYREQEKTIRQVRVEIKELFKDEPSLIEDFEKFLPLATGTKL